MVAGPSLRVAFFGTPDFAVPTLDALLASRHQVVAAVTQPDRPRGRGQKTTPSPVKARAVAAAVPVMQPAMLKDATFVEAFAALKVDLGVVAAYGRILPAALITTPRLGMINVHASLLPRHRGAAPVHRAIIAGDQVTGVTIMRVVKALDAGPMMAVRERAIGPDETSQDVERSLADIGARTPGLGRRPDRRWKRARSPPGRPSRHVCKPAHTRGRADRLAAPGVSH